MMGLSDCCAAVEVITDVRMSRLECKGSVRNNEKGAVKTDGLFGDDSFLNSSVVLA